MIIKIESPHGSVSAGDNHIRLRCPGCRNIVLFEPVDIADQYVTDTDQRGLILGLRVCPLKDCKTILYVVWRHDANELLISYPAERIEFDSANLPSRVLECLEEAITCHANGCYTAAAIMVRKTLEELCKDKGAGGKGLVDRLKALSSVVVMPQAMLTGLEDLRLLGNDAAHVELKTFDDIGRREVEACITVTTEILKAIYQYDVVMSSLAVLKKKKNP